MTAAIETTKSAMIATQMRLFAGGGNGSERRVGLPFDRLKGIDVARIYSCRGPETRLRQGYGGAGRIMTYVAQDF